MFLNFIFGKWREKTSFKGSNFRFLLNKTCLDRFSEFAFEEEVSRNFRLACICDRTSQEKVNAELVQDPNNKKCYEP